MECSCTLVPERQTIFTRPRATCLVCRQIFDPLQFEDFGLHPDLLDALDDMGFREPTPIQQQAIPQALDGKDVLAIAQTGTGKTAAFLLPVLDRICRKQIADVDTLILTPTRELAMQIETQIEGLSYYSGISSIPVYGGRDGHALDSERAAMKKGVDIIVATPGRLRTHMQMGHLDLGSLQTLVLDEADRMLDMGFIDDIMMVVSKLPKDRQTLLFSATFAPKIQKLARDLMRKEATAEVRIAISKPPSSIKQSAYYVPDHSKDALVAHILSERTELKRAIVFANRKSKVRELYRTLQRRRLTVAAIESGMEQSEREQVLRKFKNGSIPIVVATDVLSRGIDVKGIELVINYDVPGDGEDYVHRIGRTARAEAEGEAITLINPRDRASFAAIESLIEKKVPRIDLPDWLKSSADKAKPSGKSFADRSETAPKVGPSSRPRRSKNPKSGGQPSAKAAAVDPTSEAQEAGRAQNPNKRRRPKRRRPGGPKSDLRASQSES